MLITMEKDIIWTFDVVSVERSGLHALLAGKVSNDEGDHLYSACEQAQTLLLTEGQSHPACGRASQPCATLS